ncbi:MAG: hypothetical protein ABGZ35_01115, partial [Planctomycetaceae bacterium]
DCVAEALHGGRGAVTLHCGTIDGSGKHGGPVTYTAENLVELRTDANELRGCGATVAEIARALKISQAYALRLLARRSNG